MTREVSVFFPVHGKTDFGMTHDFFSCEIGHFVLSILLFEKAVMEN